MRCASACLAICAAVATMDGSETLPLVHRSRYAMGTVFDIAVYHSSRTEAERAVAAAMDEIERLDRVMSNFKSDSDLARLVRDGRTGFVRVDPTLYSVIETSVELSKQSHGVFDITVGPLVRLWKQAREADRVPSETEIAAARRCVGYEQIELSAPDRIRLRSDCLELDLGAIGKGYAVDRAIALLAASGIQHATVDAGTSSIAAIGHPPDRAGWPVTVGARTVMLRNESVSTSQQAGEIIDARTGAPVKTTVAVSVVAPTATMTDALDTTLVLLSIDEGKRLLAAYPNVSAFWIGDGRQLKAEYRSVGSAAAGLR